VNARGTVTTLGQITGTGGPADHRVRDHPHRSEPQPRPDLGGVHGAPLGEHQQVAVLDSRAAKW